MCYQLVELYSSCRCLYYQHAIDKCAAYDRPGHSITERKILVGYACPDHSKPFGDGDYSSKRSQYASTSDSGYASLPPAKPSPKRLQFDSNQRQGDEPQKTTQQPPRTTAVEQLVHQPTERARRAAILGRYASNSDSLKNPHHTVTKDAMRRTATRSTSMVEDVDADVNEHTIPSRSQRNAESETGAHKATSIKQQSSTSRKFLSFLSRQGSGLMSTLDEPAPIMSSFFPDESGPTRPSFFPDESRPIRPSFFPFDSQEKLVESARRHVSATKTPNLGEALRLLTSPNNDNKSVAPPHPKDLDTNETGSGLTGTEGHIPMSSIDETRGVEHFQTWEDKNLSTSTTPTEYGIEDSDEKATQPEQCRDLVEVLVGYFAHDPVLQHLWPQLILRSSSIRTAYQQIMCLLLGYSLDLRGSAKALNDKGDQKTSDQWLLAADAIGGSSSSISCEVCQIFWSPDFRPEAWREEFHQVKSLAKQFDSSGAWGVRESEALKDLLFDPDSLFTLRRKVKVLVERPVPLPPHIRVLDSARNWWESIYSLLAAPDLQPGRQRLFYTCVS